MSCSKEMSGFHRCTSCQAKLPANDPHDECMACLGPEHAASALADRAFCHSCAGFQMRTLRQRAKKSVGGHSPSLGSSHTISAPPSSTATPPGRLQLSTSPASQITAGQRSPTRRARERSPSPSRAMQRQVGVVELTSKMSQFMEMMMEQQSLLMSIANAVPQAPEQVTGPVANQPVAPLQPPLAVPLPVQPQDWDINAISRDASDILGEDSIEAEVASQHSDQVAESKVMDTDDTVWSVVDRATCHLGIDWPGTELPRRSLFESPSVQPHQSRMLPAFPDFVKEVQSTWGAPASAPVTSRKASAFTMQGASEAGLASFPPVDAAFAALVKTPTLPGLTKDPACPNKQCRTTEIHLKKGNELGTISQLLVKLAQLNARAQGRSIASMVVARRQLWLSQARVQEPDKAPLLDAPITPGHTFGPAVEEMLQCSVKAQEASLQMAKMWPNKQFQPKRPQEQPWRRTPPQQQAQPRGSRTSPIGPSVRGQPGFARPQRVEWRPRGGGRSRPCGSGQAPCERAQPKQP
ncbi:UNVERIFIED_CONTAM: hypothetical protein FKN15_038390 [Acipenser sinensis]